MIVLKLSFHELTTFMAQTGDMCNILMASKNNLYLLAGIVLNDLHTRLVNKIKFSFTGDKRIQLNYKEALALRQFLLYMSPQEGIFESTVRNKVFTTIDKSIL